MISKVKEIKSTAKRAQPTGPIAALAPALPAAAPALTPTLVAALVAAFFPNLENVFW